MIISNPFESREVTFICLLYLQEVSYCETQLKLNVQIIIYLLFFSFFCLNITKMM